MCHYITAVLPGSADHTSLAAVADQYGRNLTPLKNSSIEEQLKIGERYFLTTRGHCDCGTALGALGRKEKQLNPRNNSIEAEEEKLRRRGWSESKISRWKEQRDQRLANLPKSADPTDWEHLITEMLNSGKTPFVGILLHFYSGSIEGPIELQGREVIKVKSMSPEVLGRLKEDVLYEFRTES